MISPLFEVFVDSKICAHRFAGNPPFGVPDREAVYEMVTSQPDDSLYAFWIR